MLYLVADIYIYIVLFFWLIYIYIYNSLRESFLEDKVEIFVVKYQSPTNVVLLELQSDRKWSGGPKK